MLDTRVLSYFYCFYVLVPQILFKIRISQTSKMASSTRVTRSKGESDGLSLPMKSRPTRRDATSGRNRGTTSTSDREHQQQMPTQTPHTTQLPETASAEWMATAPMLPPGPHRPLTPRMPLPALPASSPNSSAPLFQEEGYSSTSEEESEVTFTHGRCNGTSPNQHAERTSTPTPSDYTTQGDPNASPSGSSRSHDITNELLGTNNFFMPDGNNRIQLRTLQPQLHPQRLRDHQVVTFDPKQSSNIPPPCRNNRNAILHQWIHRNTIPLKLRLILSKLSLKCILGKNWQIFFFMLQNPLTHQLQ